jgi:2-keto-4-pentenoate hydratase/2-oxohepta-3-ene-1,7-dioic acid hydratase in catechol pathway
MKLVTFEHAGATHVGALDGEAVRDLTAAGGPATMLEAIAAWRGGEPAPGTPTLPLAAVRLLAPIPRPGKVLCSGINYRSHFEENPQAVMPQEPFFFAKLPTSITGPGAPVAHPARTRQMDYEVEFAVVIGHRLHRAAPEQAMHAVFGYTLLNDISARDVQFRDNQITLGKNFDGFAPTGPCIVTADELPHPDRVRLRAILNGRVMQDATTAEWIFPLPVLLSSLSHVMALEPGDIVTTGTPAGVGLFRKPPVFMRPGDVIAIEAEGIGRLENRIVAPDA